MSQPLNPYDFVPFAATVKRKLLRDWLSGTRLSGELRCTLTPVSPLCIRSIFTGERCEGYIPGTSIKGMLRQLMTILSAGCGEMNARDYGYLKNKRLKHQSISDYAIEYFVTRSKFPDGDYDSSTFRACSQVDDSGENLCRTCYLMGYAGEKSARAGRIRVADSNRFGATLEPYTIMQLDMPRVYRWSFYYQPPDPAPFRTEYTAGKPPTTSFLPTYPQGLEKEFRGTRAKKPDKPQSHKIVHLQGGSYSGRKLYRHNGKASVNILTPEQLKLSPKPKSDEIYALEPGKDVAFTFTVQFRDISREDLGLLIFLLTLDDTVRHKLGYGKPLGFGSVKIDIEHLKLQQHDACEVWLAPDKEVDPWPFRDDFRASGILDSQAWEKVKDIWRWPGRAVAYPHLKEFFGKKENRSVSLDDYNARNWSTE